MFSALTICGFPNGFRFIGAQPDIKKIWLICHQPYIPWAMGFDRIHWHWMSSPFDDEPFITLIHIGKAEWLSPFHRIRNANLQGAVTGQLR